MVQSFTLVNFFLTTCFGFKKRKQCLFGEGKNAIQEKSSSDKVFLTNPNFELSVCSTAKKVKLLERQLTQASQKIQLPARFVFLTLLTSSVCVVLTGLNQ